MKPETVARRVIDYGDGWIPLDGGHEIEATLDAIRAEAARVGRPLETLDLTVGLGLLEPVREERFNQMVELGFRRILFVLPRRSPEEDRKTLDGFDELKARLS